jgi:uncharacterized protein
MKRDAIIFFLRYPELGKVKTRLAMEIGDELAYDLYRCFIQDIFKAIQTVDAETIIVGTGSAGVKPPEIFDRSFCLVQQGGDLGERMYRAFTDVFSRGFSRAVLIGSDCPGFPEDYIRQAITSLRNRDVVIGPSADGGYYLIAFHEHTLRKEIFQGISWGTSRVFTQTAEKIKDNRLALSELAVVADIDEMDDLRRFAGGDQARTGLAPHTMKFIELNKERLCGKM